MLFAEQATGETLERLARIDARLERIEREIGLLSRDQKELGTDLMQVLGRYHHRLVRLAGGDDELA